MKKVDLEAILKKNGYLQHQRGKYGQKDIPHNLRESIQYTDGSYTKAPVFYVWQHISQYKRDVLALGEFPKQWIFKVKTKDLLEKNGTSEQACFVTSIRKMTDPYDRPSVNGVVLVCGEKDYNRILDMLHADKSSSEYIVATLDSVLRRRSTFDTYNKMLPPKDLEVMKNFIFPVK